MDFNPVLIWFVIGLALVLSEFVLPGVILVFFGIGAWVACLTTWFGWTGGWTSQLLTFAIASVVLLVALRRWLKTRFFGHVHDRNDPTTDFDSEAGQLVSVTVAIEPGRDEGRVEFKGAAWKAVAEVRLEAGSRARIVGVDGIVLRVEPA
jgi:membrane protein implicated in regulation of membrane protease activity